MGHWIFQVNRKKFQVDALLKANAEFPWSVTERTAGKIFKPDRVVLWASGAAGGAFAVCTVIDYPKRQRDVTLLDQYWEPTVTPAYDEFRCVLRVDTNMADAFAPRSLFEKDRRLAKLPVLKTALTPIHALEKEDWLAFEKVLSLYLGRDAAPVAPPPEVVEEDEDDPEDLLDVPVDRDGAPVARPA
ncbi:MAG: EVE domain-containing protein [Planctomycetia bacterium]